MYIATLHCPSRKSRFLRKLYADLYSKFRMDADYPTGDLTSHDAILPLTCSPRLIIVN